MREMEGLIARLVSEKATGIGGSDIGDVLNLEPWGCRRRLYYEKTGFTPDYQEADNPLLERGIALESVALDMYERRTGRPIGLTVPGLTVLSPTRLYRHKEDERLLVHLDAVVYREPRKKGRPKKNVKETPAGVLELKTVGAPMFFKIKRDGMPDSYIMQIQHAMAVTGLSWGSFGVLWPDGWRMITFDVEAKKDLQEAAKSEALKFLEEVRTGRIPERLPASDNRCQRCPFRASCQGALLLEAAKGQYENRDDETLNGLIGRYWEYKGLYDEASDLFEGVKAEIKTVLGDCSGVEVPGTRIHFKAFPVTRVDLNKLREKYAAAAKDCEVTSAQRPLKVYAI